MHVVGAFRPVFGVIRVAATAALPIPQGWFLSQNKGIRRIPECIRPQNRVDISILDIRREHPHLNICALMDGPRSKAPQVRLLRELGMSFIIGAKSGDHKILHDQLEVDGETREFAFPDEIRLVFRWRNGAEPDNSNRDLWVHVLECREHIPERRVGKAGGSCESCRRPGESVTEARIEFQRKLSATTAEKGCSQGGGNL